jgi:hypothetical protein
MDAPHVRLIVDVTSDGHTIIGTVTADGGQPVTFAGRLGIMQAIDDAIATVDPSRDAASDQL